MGAGPLTPSELVVLVDADGRDCGTAPKLDAHRAPGLAHRAFSVVLYTGDGRMVLQRRAAVKYHFAGRWSNACCGHPRPGEAVAAAAARRLGEELGLSCPLEEVGSFSYQAADEASGLVEREVDHVLVGVTDAVADPDPAEVSDVRAIARAWLRDALRRDPQSFTPWLAQVLDVVERRPPG